MISIFAPGARPEDDELAEEIETAAEFLTGADEGVEITQETLRLRQEEMREARAALDRAEDSAARMCRAQDTARAKYVALLKAAGLVITADGLKPGTVERGGYQQPNAQVTQWGPAPLAQAAEHIRRAAQL